MHNPLDPVDRAFEALKSERWERDKSRLKLENRIMQEQLNPGAASRFRKYRTLLIAGVVMLVGGAGFAATDTGANAIKRFLVFTNIDGEPSEIPLELLEGGQATWSTTNEDGSETTINLSHSPDGNDGLNGAMADVDGADMVTVDVNVLDADTGDKTVDIAVGGEPADGTIVIDSDGTGQRLNDMMNQVSGGEFTTNTITTDGQGNAIQIIRESDGEGNVRTIELNGNTAGDSQKRLVKIDGLLGQEADGASNVEVEVGENGIATVHITRPDGTVEVREINFGDQTPGEISVQVDGNGKVKATPVSSRR